MSDNVQEFGPRLLDIHLARFMAAKSGLAQDERERFEELVRQVSMDLADGHSCLTVGENDRVLLNKSPLVSGDGTSPLVLDEDRLYLQRYYHYELRLAQQLYHLSLQHHVIEGEEELLNLYFDNPESEKEVDYQRLAASKALHHSLTIISGGPGTGKTTTVVKILALLIQAVGTHLRIGITAPTGKAANRLMESIRTSLENLSLSDEISAVIPVTASTIHRLLGVRRHQPHFIHDNENPLPYDLVVVDEASMVDLALMSKLVDALRPDCRLILLGDKDQLVSVESGAVLADCISALPENTVELRKSYRFEKGIRRFADAINRGDGEDAWGMLSGTEPANVQVLRNSYFSLIEQRYLAYIEHVESLQQFEVHDLFRSFSAFRVLCATRRGQYGVDAVSRYMENCLKKRGYDTSSGWYLGRPVMVTANDYGLELFNGDIGLCLRDPEDGRIKVWFEQVDGSVRGYHPNRIPQCDTAWAMTIHKSQGSEFSEVLVVLPEVENRSLNRQLVYTAVTRAKENVHIVASKAIIVYALQSDYPRSSGLTRFLERLGEDDVRD